MKFLFTIGFFVFCSVNALGENLTCSDASGYIKYSSVRFTGGMPPSQGDLIQVEMLYLGGTLVSEARYYEGKEKEAGTIDITWIRLNILEQKSDSTGGAMTFTAKLILEDYPGDNLNALIKPTTKFVICQSSSLAIP